MEKMNEMRDFMHFRNDRCIYKMNMLGDVICQLRFPEILTIETELPAKFQESIRMIFPVYSLRKESLAPKLTGQPGAMQVHQAPATNNYQFSTADGTWRVNLTSKFISLSTNRYTCWEDFAKMLDRPLAAFIQIYKPAYFERIGLRYLNFISRKKLDLEDTPFRELITAPYLGMLGQASISEASIVRSSVESEQVLPDGCHIKIHAGPGKVTIGGNQDPEIKFVFDQDLFLVSKVPVQQSAGALETIHSHAFSVFRNAITETLHNAMEPKEK